MKDTAISPDSLPPGIQKQEISVSDEAKKAVAVIKSQESETENSQLDGTIFRS